MLEITVHEIKGHCPVYQEGDRITIKDPEIDLDKTDALCTHALSTILHYTTILEHDWIPLALVMKTTPTCNVLTRENHTPTEVPSSSNAANLMMIKWI